MQKNGYIAISMVLLLSVVVLAVATTVSFLSIGEGQSGLALVKGESALKLTEECVEDVLIRARNSASFAANTTSTTFSEADGTCLVSKSGNTWTVYNTVPSDYRRTIQVVFTSNGYGITITSWNEM